MRFAAATNAFLLPAQLHKSFMQTAQITNITAGTIMDTRHATFGSKPAPTIGLKSTLIMKICVTPPPKLPQPAAVAFAVPTTFGANMREHQNWFVTKVAPAQPMKNLRPTRSNEGHLVLLVLQDASEHLPA